jgi:hypothetical protein
MIGARLRLTRTAIPPAHASTASTSPASTRPARAATSGRDPVGRSRGGVPRAGSAACLSEAGSPLGGSAAVVAARAGREAGERPCDLGSAGLGPRRGARPTAGADAAGGRAALLNVIPVADTSLPLAGVETRIRRGAASRSRPANGGAPTPPRCSSRGARAAAARAGSATGKEASISGPEPVGATVCETGATAPSGAGVSGTLLAAVSADCWRGVDGPSSGLPGSARSAGSACSLRGASTCAGSGAGATGLGGSRPSGST